MNLLVLFVCAGVLALAGEVWLRRPFPFVANRAPLRFVPGVGVLLEPHAEVRHTNLHEFWTISRTNRLGFLDREPLTRERAVSSCHIALVGDSFVAARQVEVSDKAQVRLEALAARERPDWGVTTSAFGRAGTGQVQQIPFYDAYIRRTSPKVVVLVSYRNDFSENSAALDAVFRRRRPECDSFASAVRGEDGDFALRLPEPPCGAGPWRRALTWLERGGRLGQFLGFAVDRGWIRGPERVAALRRRSWRQFGSAFPAFSGWRPPAAFSRISLDLAFHEARLTEPGWRTAARDAFDSTSFALVEFRKRGWRDGFELLFLTADGDELGATGAMPDLAERHGLPVISLRDWITERGERVGDALFPRDGHWSPKGHRRAAEALWEYLKKRPSLCGRAPRG